MPIQTTSREQQYYNANSMVQQLQPVTPKNEQQITFTYLKIKQLRHNTNNNNGNSMVQTKSNDNNNFRIKYACINCIRQLCHDHYDIIPNKYGDIITIK